MVLLDQAERRGKTTLLRFLAWCWGPTSALPRSPAGVAEEATRCAAGSDARPTRRWSTSLTAHESLKLYTALRAAEDAGRRRADRVRLSSRRRPASAAVTRHARAAVPGPATLIRPSLLLLDSHDRLDNDHQDVLQYVLTAA